ncbi:MAG TPA: DUF1801 domain-containing protein [Candidatus Saccharimonadales bacterium]|nr:DUF1801 domain-containing protein [Candidatus Saccharimonadales bacterium]
MTSSQIDQRIDDYIATLPAWQQEICSHVRKLVHEADKEIVETIKRTNRPYFVLNGNICALLATRDHVNVFIYDPIAPDPEHIINQGENNATARAIQIYQNDKLNEKAFVELVRAVAANNRAGGWRKVQKEK